MKPRDLAEMLLLAPSMLVPSLQHNGIKVWDTLAIGEYLAETVPGSGLLPSDRAARAHCRAVCGEMHSGFASLRASLPMNLKGDFPRHKVWSRAQGDIERIAEIWRECLAAYGGPYLFGVRRCMADAMYAPVATRFVTYHVALDKACAAYCRTIYAMPEMQEWIEAARLEPDEIAELSRRTAEGVQRRGLQLRLITSARDVYRSVILDLHRALVARGAAHEQLDLPGPHALRWNRGPGALEMLLWHDRALRGEPPLR